MKIIRFPLSLIRKISVSFIIVILVFGIARSPGVLKYVKQIRGELKWPFERPSPLITTRVYITHLLCGHHDLVTNENQKMKLIKEATCNYHPSGELIIRTKDQQRLYYFKETGWCSSCSRYKFLGIQGSNIVVRNGTPWKPGPVQEIVKLSLSHLPFSERQDLRIGIPFTNEKEKLQIVESLSELMAD